MVEVFSGMLAVELAKGVIATAGDRIYEGIEKRIILVTSFTKNLSKIGEDLIELSYYVKDATSKYDEHPDSIKHWTIKLYQVALDAQDVLDLIQAHQTNPSSTLSGFHVRFRLEMGRRMRETQSSIKELYGKAGVLGLVKEMNDSQLANHNSSRKEGCTLRDENTSVGLDSKVGHIRSLLKQNRVVAVVGMGGIGKTRLLQHVFKKIKSKYEIAVWLSLTQRYNIRSLQADILSQLKYESTLEDVQASDNRRQDIILELLAQKKSCLFVLDDVWDLTAEEAGRKFQSVFQKLRRIGLPENGNFNVLISTRENNVAKHFKAEIYRMEVLNKEESMRLFCYHATPRFPDDEDLVEEVLMRCGGLPLEVLTVAGVLAHQRNEDWHVTLRDFKCLPSGVPSGSASAATSSVMSVLGLSYKALPCHLKRCFASLSFFSSWVSFWDEQVICLWQAQGLVSSVEDAREAIEELISRSLLQKFEHPDGRVPIERCVTMHDKVSELAWSISTQIGDLCCHVEDTEQWKNARLVYLCDKMPAINGSVCCSRKVSTLSLFNNIGLEVIPPQFLAKAKSLKVLDISRTSITNLPDNFFSNLKLLKYVNISDNDMKEVPQCIRMLKYLECLYLPEAIEILPAWLGELSRLQVIHSHCSSMLYNTKWLSKLRFLRVVGDYILKMENGGLGWSDLSTLPLQSINLVGDSESVLGQEDNTPPRSLESVNVRIEHNVCNMPDSWKTISNADVLRTVNMRLPRWVAMFQRLRVLTLGGGSIDGSYLKDISILPCLQALYLGSNSRRIRLPDEFGKSHSFPMLNDLQIDGLTNLVALPEMEEGAMPCLKCLVIKECPALQNAFTGFSMVLSGLDLLCIEACEEVFTAELISTNIKACLAWEASGHC